MILLKSFQNLIYVFLYETWTNSENDISLNRYVSYNFYRKIQNRKARRSSGGIALYYKESLKDGIQVIKNRYDTIIWLKIDRTFFQFERGFIHCGAYIWGEDSPMYSSFNIDLFDVLENDIFEYSSLGSVAFCGDLNSRIGRKNDYIVHDTVCADLDEIDYMPDRTSLRASIDNVQNKHGIKLLDLCKTTVG